MTKSSPRVWAIGAAIALVYVVAAKLGLELSVAYSNATPVWAPVGISLVALLLFGRKMWPAIALGAFVANALTSVPLWVAAVIAVGNTLEALVGSELLVRVARFRLSLDRVKDVLSLVLFGAIVSTAVSASIGTSALAISGQVPWDRFAYTWQLWWHGDAMGVLIVAPLLLSWGVALRTRERPEAPFEEGLLMVGVVLAASLVFLGGSWRYPYILFPLLVWAALRFKQRGATTAIFAMSVLAIAGILNGTVPVGGVTATASVQIFQTLIALMAMTTLILTASVAEKEKSRSEMKEGASLLQATLDSTTDGILVIDFEARITSFNRRFLEMWDIPDDHAAPGDLAEVFASFLDRLEDPEQVFASELALFEQHESESVEVFLLKDGRRIERYSQPQRIDRIPVGRVWSFRDVTKQKELEEARIRFINDAAHELRNPASVIVGIADLLKDRETSEDELKKLIAGMGRQADKMNALLKRMLDLGRLESRPAQDLAPVQVASVVDEVLESVIIPSHCSLLTSIPSDLTALAEEGSLDQVLVNLLTNAVRYGGPTIKIGAFQASGRIHLWIEDDGPGIDPTVATKIFDPFHRASTNSDGFGLGLAIVRSLLVRMNGEVAYSRIEPHGTRFTVSLLASS
ncbi:MAG: hypothetical protein QOG54_2638 [Actinomycetota bacterium]|nr:hypothetical protein [Actinomycetota bacterium]